MTKSLEKRRVRRYVKRNAKGYATLRSAAQFMLDQARTHESGSYYFSMASLAFTAFSVEGLLNHVGQLLSRDWTEKYGRLSLEEKTDHIARAICLDLCKGTRPFQTIAKLFDVRNRMAHPRTEFLQRDEVREISGDAPDFSRDGFLVPDWEKNCNVTFALRARDDSERFMRIVYDAARDWLLANSDREDFLDFYESHGSQTGTVNPENE